MRKFGRFMFSFVPILGAFGAQIVAAIIIFTFLLFSSAGGRNFSISIITSDPISETNATLLLIYCAIIIPTYIFWYQKMYKGTFTLKGKKVFNIGKITGAIAVVPGMQMISSFIVLFVIAMVSLLYGTPATIKNAHDADFGILMTLYAILIGPITEEVIFRGLTMRSFRKVIPFWAANFFQAALFGIYHLNLTQGLYTFALGLVLGFVCERGGSIYYSILTHILFNIWGTYVAWDTTHNPDGLLITIMILITVASLSVGFFLFHLGKKAQPVEDEPFPEINEMPKTHYVSQAYQSNGYYNVYGQYVPYGFYDANNVYYQNGYFDSYGRHVPYGYCDQFGNIVPFNYNSSNLANLNENTNTQQGYSHHNDTCQ